MHQNFKTSYGRGARLFHWVMVPMFIGMFALAYLMMDTAPGEAKWALYGLHKSFGVVLLVLILARFLWRLSTVPPALPSGLSSFQKGMVQINHFLLYAVMFGMACSGVAMSLLGGHGLSLFGVVDIASPYINKDLARLAHTAHEIISYVFMGSVFLHLAGAFYHHFVLKDGLLKRMRLGP